MVTTLWLQRYGYNVMVTVPTIKREVYTSFNSGNCNHYVATINPIILGLWLQLNGYNVMVTTLLLQFPLLIEKYIPLIIVGAVTIHL